jgi:ribosomal protein L35
MSGKLMNKSPKQKRQFSKDKSVSDADAKKVKKLLGRA